MFCQSLHHRPTGSVTLTLLQPAALHFPTDCSSSRNPGIILPNVSNHVHFRISSSIFLDLKKTKQCVIRFSPFLAPQRHQGDSPAPAEVVRPPVHRHRGGRSLLLEAALSVAEGWGDTAAGSGHAEVSRKGQFVHFCASFPPFDLSVSEGSGVAPPSRLQLSRSNSHTCAQEQKKSRWRVLIVETEGRSESCFLAFFV